MHNKNHFIAAHNTHKLLLIGDSLNLRGHRFRGRQRIIVDLVQYLLQILVHTLTLCSQFGAQILRLSGDRPQTLLQIILQYG